MKGLVTALLQWCGLSNIYFEQEADASVHVFANKQLLGTIQNVPAAKLGQFDLKQSVYFVDLPFDSLLSAIQKIKVV